MARQLVRYAGVPLAGRTATRAAGAAERCKLPWLSPGRIMRPDDANVAGNVHGGTILKMIEEAGAIISTRHCNSQAGVSRCQSAAGPWLSDSLTPPLHLVGGSARSRRVPQGCRASPGPSSHEG